MRLEDMSLTDYLTAEFDLKERQRKERMKRAEFEKYAKEHNIFYCTKELGEQIKVEKKPILEQIRAEIENQLFVGRILNSKDFDDGLKYCLEIIDEYTKGVSE